MSRKIGFKHSEETRRKIREANMGKHPSEESLKKMSEAKKGKHLSPRTEFKKGYIPYNKGIPNPEFKKCSMCGKTKSPKEFGKSSNNISGLRSLCKECRQENYKKLERESSWKRNIRRRFGMSSEEYNSLFEKQGGKCAICGKSSRPRLSIDHNHKTGKVRALLCYKCNAFIGMAEENILFLEKAIKYLEEHNRE